MTAKAVVPTSAQRGAVGILFGLIPETHDVLHLLERLVRHVLADDRLVGVTGLD